MIMWCGHQVKWVGAFYSVKGGTRPGVKLSYATLEHTQARRVIETSCTQCITRSVDIEVNDFGVGCGGGAVGKEWRMLFVGYPLRRIPNGGGVLE